MKRLIFALVALVGLCLFWGCSNDSPVSVENRISSYLKGSWCIVQNVHSEKVLTVSKQSKKDGANVNQHDYYYSEAQKFQVGNVGKGYILMAEHSGKVLTITGNVAKNGANVVQKEYEKDLITQLWDPVEDKNGNFKFVSVCSGKVLTVARSSIKNNANVIQYDDYSGDSQLWKLLIKPPLKITNK